jgi:hypothetical protein
MFWLTLVQLMAFVNTAVNLLVVELSDLLLHGTSSYIATFHAAHK